jgi:adenosylcobyric acid synthase
MLHEHGWEHELHAYVRRGGRVMGVCAGYQMLGRVVRDLQQIEGGATAMPGFGLLDIETDMSANKVLREVAGTESITGAQVSGYEMHVGRSTTDTGAEPMIRFDDGSQDGAVKRGGRVFGCHLHGLLAAPEYRAALLGMLGTNSTAGDYREKVNSALDDIAGVLERSMSVAALSAIAAT